MTDVEGLEGLHPGPWDDEPDRLEWRHQGLPCLIRRNRLGVWCGYVGVPPGHQFYGRSYDEIPVEVHGGLTYADFCDGDEGHGICHVPRDGEPADVFWLGFDCGHGNDLIPKMLLLESPLPWTTYRDIAYVQAETERLAEQLSSVRHHPLVVG